MNDLAAILIICAAIFGPILMMDYRASLERRRAWERLMAAVRAGKYDGGAK